MRGGGGGDASTCCCDTIFFCCGRSGSLTGGIAISTKSSTIGSGSGSGITTTGAVYEPNSTCELKFGAFSGNFGTVIKLTKYCKFLDCV